MQHELPRLMCAEHDQHPGDKPFPFLCGRIDILKKDLDLTPADHTEIVSGLFSELEAVFPGALLLE